MPTRGIRRGWEVALGGAKVLGLPTKVEPGNYEPGASWTFSKVMKVVWDEEQSVDDEEGEYVGMMEDLGVGETLEKSEVKMLLRKRPECWR